MFDRVSLDSAKADPELAKLPTDARLAAVEKGRRRSRPGGDCTSSMAVTC